MNFRFSENTAYNYCYLKEKLLEKPFFLGCEGIEGRIDGEGFWQFSFNPAICITNVCENNNLEELVILFLHLKRFNDKIDYSELTDCSLITFFDTMHTNISIVLDRLAREIDLENSTDVDIMMIAYNLFLLMNDSIINCFHKHCFLKSSAKLSGNFRRIDTLKTMWSEVTPHENPKIHFARKMLLAGCSNLQFTLMDVINIIMINDLKFEKTELVKNSDGVDFFSDGTIDLTADLFYEEYAYDVQISNDSIDFKEYTNFTTIQYHKLQKELQRRDTGLKKLNNHDLDSVSQSILAGNMNIFLDITKHFIEHFWKVRSETRKSKVCFTPENTLFIFRFTIFVLDCLKKIPNDHPEHEQLLKDNFLQFGNILNSLRFSEIHAAISMKTAVSLSKTLDELIENLIEQEAIDGMPAIMKLVATRITLFVGMVKKNKCYTIMAITDEVLGFPFIDVKPIEDLESVSSLRRSEWIDMLSSYEADDGTVIIYNQDECPVCLNDQEDDCCVLICKHTLCSSCTDIMFNKTRRRSCPVCRNPVNEFVQRNKIEEICKNSEQYLATLKDLPSF